MPREQLLINAHIYTMDVEFPLASALAISGDHILAVGHEPDELRDLLSSGSMVRDLGGRCVLPGLTDSHVHFTSYALGHRQVDLSGAATLNEMMATVSQWARAVELDPPPTGSWETWIVGRGWDQERWCERRFPTAAELDTIVPNRPVALRAKSGHALVANSLALQRGGITTATPDPPGGRIGRDAEGHPNGMLFEGSAMEMVTSIVPPPGPDLIDSALRDAIQTAWRMGLTGVHDVDDTTAFAAYQRLHARGNLGLRVVEYLPADMIDCALSLGLRAGLGDDWLRVGGIKAFVDGALGPRTAAMLAPYEGAPDNVGVLTTDEETLRELARKSMGGGLPLAVHAIGDRANRMVLDALAEVGTGRLRHRIEHVQLLHPADVGRLGALGIVASMQPIHATQDCEMADRYWGERCATAYAWRSLLDTGTVLAFGSDSPVEDLNPFLGIHAAVTRRRSDGFPGPHGWQPQERLTVEEAVRAYTLGAAYAAGLEDRLGTLSPGKLADLVVLDRDVFRCDPMAIATTRVVGTMTGGKLVHWEP